MTVVAAALFGLALWMLAWSYLVYPPLVRRLAAGARPRVSRGPAPSSVEVLVSAADEEAVIGDRVENLLAQRFPGRYRVTIGCDGSADRTADVASAFVEASADKGSAFAKASAEERAEIRVVQFPARRGKAAVLNDLVLASGAEVLVFTDANTRFEPEAVARLAGAFEDPEVGAACGRLLLEGSETESAFWDRETALKEAEGRLGVCLGANGAIYAARRAEVEPVPPDTTSMDDFLIPLSIARQGRRVVFVGDAVARERTSRDARAEMGRRFRIGVGAGQVLRRQRWLWNVLRHGLLSLAYFSRKVARWLAPVAALAAVAAACVSAPLRPLGGAALAAALLIAGSACLRPRLSGAAGRLYYFGVVNLALAAGVIAGLFGYSRPVWKPVSRGV